MIFSYQIRAGRALAGLTQADVAVRTGLSVPTVKRAEAKAGIGVSDNVMQAIVRALEAAGVAFIVENGGGPGVRLRAKG